MTDKELIKEEIERRIKEISDACDGVIMVETISVEYNTLCNIMDYINSLPEENHFEDKSEMVSEDLDIVAASIIKRLGGMEKDDCVSEHELKIFKAAIDWQKQKDQETIELAEDHAMLAGMNKMKEEMMENAVEGDIFREIKSPSNIEFQLRSKRFKMEGIKLGDKVKIIIVKEE